MVYRGYNGTIDLRTGKVDIYYPWHYPLTKWIRRIFGKIRS